MNNCEDVPHKQIIEMDGSAIGPSCTSTAHRGGDEKVSDSMVVERDEMLRMIEHLEEVVVSLQDVNAGVSKEYAEELQRLRDRLLQAQSPKEWRLLLDFAVQVLAMIAAELLKAWFF
jgi:hypothetical protein